MQFLGNVFDSPGVAVWANQGVYFVFMFQQLSGDMGSDEARRPCERTASNLALLRFAHSSSVSDSPIVWYGILERI